MRMRSSLRARWMPTLSSCSTRSGSPTWRRRCGSRSTAARSRSAGGDLFGGDHRNDLILLARNAASGKSLAHDGARLLSWTVAQLRALRIPIGGNMATVERITWNRLGSDANARIWSARVTATFSSIS